MGWYVAARGGSITAREIATNSRFLAWVYVVHTRDHFGLWLSEKVADSIAVGLPLTDGAWERAGKRNRRLVRTSCRGSLVNWILPASQEVERVAVHGLG